MWIDVFDSYGTFCKLYDVVPSLEKCSYKSVTVEEGGKRIRFWGRLYAPVDHPRPDWYTDEDGNVKVCFDFYGVKHFQTHIDVDASDSNTELLKVDGCVVFHGYGERRDFSIVAEGVTLKRG